MTTSLDRRRACTCLAAIVSTALLAAPAGCRTAQAAHQVAPEVPAGEVWLSPSQLQHLDLRLEPVAPRDVEDSITAGGRVTFDDARVTHVFSPVSGRVTRIDARLGQHVEPGASLAVIQSPDVGIASSDLRKAEADITAASHDVQRQRQLVAQGAASQRDAEQAEDVYRRAQAELLRARARVQLFHARGDVTQGYAVRAEIGGDVITRLINPGMEVQGQYAGGSPMELFTIGALDRIWVLADIYEVDLARVRAGSDVTVHSVAYPDRVFHGRVDWVSQTLDPLTRTARVRATFDNADHALRPEMYTTVEIAAEPRHALAVPRTSVLRVGDQTVVFVAAGRAPDGRQRFVRSPVTVDEGTAGRWVPVEHGLAPGAEVVSASGIQLLGML